MLTSGTDAGLSDIAVKLDGLPLALATAGSFLFQASMPASKYLQYHNTSWLELQRMSPKLFSYEDQTIYTTWNMSYIHIRKADMSAAKLLEFWAYFDNNNLWYDLLEAGDDDEAQDWFRRIVRSELAFEAAVLKLQNHALVQRSKDSHGYSMHHCVHAWVKNVLSKTIEDQNMRQALACVEQAVPVEAARGDWMMEQRLLPHTERILELLSHWDQEGSNTEVDEKSMAQFFHRVGDLYCGQARLTKAESLLLRASDSYKRAYGPDFEETPRLLHSLARLYGKQGLLTKAESIYKRAMTHYEDNHGPDHESTLCVVNDLAVLYSDQGKYTKAESMYLRIINARQKTLGSDYGSVVELGNLGSLYMDQGKLREAEPLCQWALISYEQAVGEDHRRTLNAVHNLGRLYNCQGRLKEAESMYQRALNGYERTLGRDHYSTLEAVGSFGILYRQQGKLKEAESMYQRALKGKEKAFGQDHLSTLGATNNLGVLYLDQGKLKEAESMFMRALRGYTQTPPPDPKDKLRLFCNIGLVYQDMQNFEEAIDFFSQAYQGSQQLLGSQHNDTIRALIQVNIEMVRNEQPAAFVSGVVSMPMSEQTTEAEVWTNIEKSVAEKTSDLSAENTSEASQDDTEDGEESAEESKSCIAPTSAHGLTICSYRITCCANQCSNQSGNGEEG